MWTKENKNPRVLTPITQYYPHQQVKDENDSAKQLFHKHTLARTHIEAIKFDNEKYTLSAAPRKKALPVAPERQNQYKKQQKKCVFSFQKLWK